MTSNTNKGVSRVGLVSKPNDYMSSLRQNLQILMGQNDMSVHQLAEKAEISYETLKSLIYGSSKDCRISTVISIAHAFGISVDELVGCETIDPVVCESIQITRSLPPNYVRFVRWTIRYHARMLKEKKVSKKAVNVMLAENTNEGNIILTNNFSLVDVSEISEIVRPKVFMGIRLPSDNYMPVYDEGDILLIANDRNPMPREVSVIIFGGYLWLAKRVIAKDSVDYYSIRDGKFRVSEADIDENLGYIAAKIHGNDVVNTDM